LLAISTRELRHTIHIDGARDIEVTVVFIQTIVSGNVLGTPTTSCIDIKQKLGIEVLSQRNVVHKVLEEISLFAAIAITRNDDTMRTLFAVGEESKRQGKRCRNLSELHIEGP